MTWLVIFLACAPTMDATPYAGVFAAVDDNRDGRISAAEYASAAPPVAATFTEADLDANEQLSLYEIAQLVHGVDPVVYDPALFPKKLPAKGKAGGPQRKGADGKAGNEPMGGTGGGAGFNGSAPPLVGGAAASGPEGAGPLPGGPEGKARRGNKRAGGGGPGGGGEADGPGGGGEADGPGGAGQAGGPGGAGQAGGPGGVTGGAVGGPAASLVYQRSQERTQFREGVKFQIAEVLARDPAANVPDDDDLQPAVETGRGSIKRRTLLANLRAETERVGLVWPESLVP